MIIGGILILAGIGLASEGSWGAAFVAWVIALFIICCWKAEKMETAAWYNRTKYWAEGDPDRKRTRREPYVEWNEEDWP